ncbi:MAG: sigma-54 dependent transcriptional regulator [Albidovulum sp.]
MTGLADGIEASEPSRGDAAATAGSGTLEASRIDRALANISVLVLDDEPGTRNFLRRVLAPRVHRLEEAASAEEASRLLDVQHFDLVVLDNVMPGQSGLDWLAEQRRVGLFAEAILITAYADLETAIHALRLGAADFVLKPFRSNQILNAVARCMDQRFLRRENFLLKHELKADAVSARGRLIGDSPGIEGVRRTLARLAKVSTPVLFTGETGTGKEVAARTLHAMSDRAGHAFVPINCATVDPDRLMTDLFGDLSSRRDGILALASGGTLYLDEVAELPRAVQAALLRVVEENRIRPLGAEREIPLNLRFLFATGTDLGKAVEAGRFRRDLWHRINVMTVHMPPLRERVGDIPELAGHLMGLLSRQLGVARLPLDEPVLRALAGYRWPGNVRELKNLIERSLILGGFPPEFAGAARPGDGEPLESLHAVERRHILSVLEACGGNRAEAARRLGISRKTIDRKCAMWDV